VIHYSDQPASAIQVSNREKTSGIVYAGVPSVEPVRLAMTVAIALYHGERDETLQELRSELARLDAATHAVPAPVSASNAIPAVEPSDPATSPTDEHPGAPESTASPSAGITSSTPATPPPMWAPDPHGRHQYRYWDGSRWTDYVADNGQESRDPPAGST
jgi:hypothetical protein